MNNVEAKFIIDLKRDRITFKTLKHGDIFVEERLNHRTYMIRNASVDLIGSGSLSLSKAQDGDTCYNFPNSINTFTFMIRRFNK